MITGADIRYCLCDGACVVCGSVSCVSRVCSAFVVCVCRFRDLGSYLIVILTSRVANIISIISDIQGWRVGRKKKKMGTESAHPRWRFCALADRRVRSIGARQCEREEVHNVLG